MKKTILVTFCFCIALLSAMTAQAQDVIHRKNGKTIEAKVLEIGEAEVKYKLFTQPDGVTFVMDATLIKKIVMANGAVHKFEEGGSIDNAEYYEGQNKSAYKISFLAWTMGYTTLTYEHNIKPGASYEAKLGIIGAGRNESLYNYSSNGKANQRGAYVSLGYKFTHKPDYYSSRQHYAHLLKGGYIRPEVTFGSYGVDSYSYTGTTSYSTKRITTTYGCLMLCAGKQWVFDNKFAIDFSYGIGTGFMTNSNSSNTVNGYTYESSYPTQYGNTILPNNLAFSFGLNIGLLGK
jgi:hypothetical protein